MPIHLSPARISFVSLWTSRLLIKRGISVAMLTIATSLWLTAPAIADINEPLPELGDSASRILPPAQAKRIGQQFLRQLLRDNSYVDDIELNAYVNRIGARVAKNASLRGTPISIHLVKNKELNAYAIPGGHITLHSALLLSAENESEFASVVGHEIAHISQLHLPRILAKANSASFPAAAAILAAIAVGGKAGAAGLTVATAALRSNQLAYTRDFEREADSVGIKLVANAGFDPNGMAGFFEKLGRVESLGEKTPGFLRTHPLSWARISEAENRASTYPSKKYQSSLEFQLAKAKIRALFSVGERGQALNWFKDKKKNASSPEEKAAAIYGIALAQNKLRQTKQASATLKPLLTAYPNEVAFQVAQAQIDIAAGNPRLAVARYATLTQAHPKLNYLVNYQAEALLANNDATQAKRVIRHQLRRHKDDLTLYLLLAKINGKLGLMAESHQANAEFHAALDEHQLAVDSLKQALRQTTSKGYLRNSISARITELEEKIELEKPSL